MKVKNPFFDKKKKVLKELDKLRAKYRVIDKRKAESKDLEEKINIKNRQLKEIKKKSREFLKKTMEKI
ncbi:DUF632 domain-containing protein [Candidatus Woesearchaeota archaeon]|nr:DUF632 domain-containing protein [Candidatus Woesearchaeota archaeon]